MGILDGIYSLGRNINKAALPKDAETAQGIVSDLLPELTLEMEDSELVKLAGMWEKAWEGPSQELRKLQDENENYWLGKHFEGASTSGYRRALVDNLIFEALETFLPIATKQNPEPMVGCDGTEEGSKLAKTVQQVLVSKADALRLKLKLKRVTRNWALYLLGVAKMGWSEVNDDFAISVIRPQKMILDPTATIEEGGEYTGEYVGEYRRDTAKNLILRFPKSESYLKEQTNDKLATEVQYVEWWTKDYVFWTLRKRVLGKNKNPHWNYEEEVPGEMDEYGNVGEARTVPGRNHFKTRKIPYVFLSIFNLGTKPYDETSLITQNLALQDVANKRMKQIDKNADNTNGTLVISGDAFTKEDGAAVADAYRKGNPIWVPNGDVGKAVNFARGGELPGFVYQNLLDVRNELRNIFGTRGSNAAGIASEQTVRGKIMVRGSDESRIGGLITEYIEQFADQLFNWMIQMMYVYYTEPKVASVVGENNAREYVEISSESFTKQLTVSVKEGSLIPKDELTKRNEAIDLWSAGAIDPVTLFDRLGFPDPKDAAEKLFMWKTAPQLMFPEIVQQMQQQQAQQMAQQGGAPPGSAPEPTGQGAIQPQQTIENPIQGDPGLGSVPIQ